MIHWAWTIAAFLAGVFVGARMVAWAWGPELERIDAEAQQQEKPRAVTAEEDAVLNAALRASSKKVSP